MYYNFGWSGIVLWFIAIALTLVALISLYILAKVEEENRKMQSKFEELKKTIEGSRFENRALIEKGAQICTMLKMENTTKSR